MRGSDRGVWGRGAGLGLLMLLAAQGLRAQDAEAQFRKQCMSCHTIGMGAKTGPDLKNVNVRRSKDWVVTFIQGPGAAIERGDATALQLLKDANNVKMPDLGITPAEADALFRMVEDYSKQGKTLGSLGITRPATLADIIRGKDLFEGRIRFSKGGPSCLSCHSASGAGPFGGGRLGPDLTMAQGRYGKGLASAIENPAFPSMQGPFAKNGLSAEEAFQVAAYLGSVSGKPPAKRDPVFPIIGLLGLAGGLGVGARLGGKRFRGARKQLESKA